MPNNTLITNNLKNNTVSKIALLEISIYLIIILLYWDFIKEYIVVIMICSAPAFLRTNNATVHGVRIIEKTYNQYVNLYKFSKFEPTRLKDRRRGIIIPVYSILARFFPVLKSIFSEPLSVISAIGENWKKNVLNVDIFSFYEFVPGWIDEKKSPIGLSALRMFFAFLISVVYIYLIQYIIVDLKWNALGFILSLIFLPPLGSICLIFWLRIAPKVSFIAYLPLIFSSINSLKSDFKEIIFDLASLSNNNKPYSPYEVMARKTALYSFITIILVWSFRFGVDFINHKLFPFAPDSVSGNIFHSIIFPNGDLSIPLYEILALICALLTFFLWFSSFIIARNENYNYLLNNYIGSPTI
ncbi:MAG: hypothetical protein QM504_11910 [Pseudomonadota bacterium]